MWKRKDSLPEKQVCRTKPMVSCFKTYGFTPQNLWFHCPKPMVLQLKSIGFASKHLFFSSVEKHFLCNNLLIKGLQKPSQNPLISHPWPFPAQHRTYGSPKLGKSMIFSPQNCHHVLTSTTWREAAQVMKLGHHKYHNRTLSAKLENTPEDISFWVRLIIQAK